MLTHSRYQELAHSTRSDRPKPHEEHLKNLGNIWNIRQSSLPLSYTDSGPPDKITPGFTSISG